MFIFFSIYIYIYPIMSILAREQSKYVMTDLGNGFCKISLCIEIIAFKTIGTATWL